MVFCVFNTDAFSGNKSQGCVISTLRQTILTLENEDRIIPKVSGDNSKYHQIRMKRMYQGEDHVALMNNTFIYYFSEEDKASRLITISKNAEVTQYGVKVNTKNNYKASFIMDKHGNIFIENEQLLGPFQHSSFTRGEPVAAAGNIRIDNGKIVFISNNSGHYAPPPEIFIQFIQ